MEETERDVLDLLTEQHRVVRDLMSTIATGPSSERAEPFEMLARLLAVHETAEEEVVHPRIRRIGDTASDLVQTRLDEESASKKVLADLEKMDPTSSEFELAFLSFQQDVEFHAENEESTIFPLLMADADVEERTRLGSMFVAAEVFAPTHAHRMAPDSALGNMLVGPPIAVFDRVRDAIKDRRQQRSS
jgi:hemerythrin superfamily protein